MKRGRRTKTAAARDMQTAIALVKDALASGERPSSAKVMELCGVSRATAIRLLDRAGAAVGAAAVQVAVGRVLAAETALAAPTGFDARGALATSIQRLAELSELAARDVRHARASLHGEADGGPRATLKDLARLYGACARLDQELLRAVDTHADLMGQLYTFETLERFVTAVHESIRETCPQHMREIQLRVAAKGSSFSAVARDSA